MSDGRPVRVLLVEDDEDDYVLITGLLSAGTGLLRFTVEWAQTPDAAVAALLANRHDVCLLDYRLGARDGLEVLREATRAGCRLPIIIVTGHTDPEVDVRAMEEGAADYLGKDQLDAGTLERAIRYALRWKRSEDALRKTQAGLETKVRERTAELTAANASLQAEIAWRKGLEEELRQRARALAEADRRKDEFLAMLAHELRNPLAPIRNALEIMKLRDPGDRDLGWARDVIDRQMEQLTRLVDDLLDVARITRGKITLDKEPLELADVAARAVEAGRPFVEAHGHELRVSLPPGPVRLLGDATRLAQVFTNLLNNAAKYTPEGGRVWLTAAREGDDAVVRVRDSGVGIPAEMLPHVFDLFTQLDRSLDRSQGGLGIGLTLVRRLVEMHGGSVQAFSEGAGRGSEFVVRLPLLEGQGVARRDPEPAAGAATPARRRVLVVDDNKDAAQTLAVVLRLSGHDVRAVHDGATALEAARAFRPEVVILDIGLPGMDGYEVARRLRREPGLDGVTLVAATGYGQEEDRRRSRDAGFDHHFVKPLDPEALKALLTPRGRPESTPADSR